MDKTLSEGCLFKMNEKYYKILGYGRSRQWVRFCEYWKIKKETLYCSLFDFYDILWHYDITAIDKTFQSMWYVIDLTLPNRARILDPIDEIWTYPRKPPHLYTEQQKKDLLELLKKLWQE